MQKLRRAPTGPAPVNPAILNEALRSTVLMLYAWAGIGLVARGAGAAPTVAGAAQEWASWDYEPNLLPF